MRVRCDRCGVILEVDATPSEEEQALVRDVVECAEDVTDGGPEDLKAALQGLAMAVLALRDCRAKVRPS